MPLLARPIVLIVLDGFGISPPDPSNAVTLARKPFFDSLLQEYPSMLLEASGLNVGLPRNEVGNSEVGHITIGSGILKYQSLPRIDKSIEDGSFAKLPCLEKIKQKLKKGSGKLHLMGLIGNGGVHSSEKHLHALIDWSKKEKLWNKTFIHAFLDGRDTGKDTAVIFLRELQEYAKETGKIATIGGRYFGMDRNLNWDRIKRAYDAIVFGKSDTTCDDPVTCIQNAYAKNVYDEELVPTVITKRNAPIATIEDGDCVIYFNFRADRGRQLAEALSEKTFTEFERKPFTDLTVATFAEYKKGMPVDVLFPPEIVVNPITKVFSDHGLRQIHIAETEKYAHVTFFMNGLQETPFPGEDRILIPSPAVTSYDQQPEMSGFEVTNKILEAIESGLHDFFVINYANADMVGHTGNLDATIRAIESTDACLSKVVQAATSKGGLVFIVGDHGNAEILINPVTNEPDKEHNFSPVPFIIVGNSYKGRANPGIIENDMSILQPVGLLSDVAPTILNLAGLPIAPEMTGTKLY